jgi:hypothetical protein
MELNYTVLATVAVGALVGAVASLLSSYFHARILVNETRKLRIEYKDGKVVVLGLNDLNAKDAEKIKALAETTLGARTDKPDSEESHNG